MKLEIKNEDIDTLCDLVFLGNWLVNSHRLTENQIQKYNKLSIKVRKLHRHVLSPNEQKLLDKDDTPFYLERLSAYIDEYDSENCFISLAQKLAEANYPINPQSKNYYNSISMQIDAQRIYEQELTQKGTSILSVDIPNIDDILETHRQALKKKR